MKVTNNEIAKRVQQAKQTNVNSVRFADINRNEFRDILPFCIGYITGDEKHGITGIGWKNKQIEFAELKQ